MIATELLGFLAAGCVLAAHAMKTMRWLRMTAIAANVLFLAYASLTQIWPMLFLHCALLPLNIARLRELARTG